jgi:PadR family transcriptional regulator AphA
MALRHLLLGIIYEYPATGYDIDKNYRTIFNNFWAAKQRQIYHMLNKLHDEGLLRMERIEQENAPAKKVYHLTEAGEQALFDWLRRPLPLQPTRDAWLGQLHLGRFADQATVIANLEHRARLLRDKLQEVSAWAATFRNALETQVNTARWPVRNVPIQLSTLHHGVHELVYEYRWTQQAIERMRRLQEDGDQAEAIAHQMLDELERMYAGLSVEGGTGED